MVCGDIPSLVTCSPFEIISFITPHMYILVVTTEIFKQVH